jgi:type I restriction enzyme, S subunit
MSDATPTMPDGWADTTWGDIATLEYGRALRGYEDRVDKFRVYGTNGPIGWHSEALSPTGTVVIGRKGAYRGVHLSKGPCWVIDTAFYLKPRLPLNLRWVYYQLLTQDINRMDSGSAIPSTSRDAFYQLPVRVPPEPIQRAIAHILGTLDDKIELNRQMNQTLEQIAAALFKSWFVDFDPVRAKAAGRQPEGMDAETAALFPDRLVESEIGEIPQGWDVERVERIGSIVCGKTPSTRNPDYYGDDVPFITIPDMRGRIFATATQKRISFAGAASQARKTLPAGSIAVSCIATPGLVAITSEAAQTNQQINTVIPNDKAETYFWYWSLRNLGDEIRRGGSGGSVFANLSTSRFAALRVLAPPASIRHSYHQLVAPMFDRILSNDRESSTVIALRDVLLPRFLSGELRIPLDLRDEEAEPMQPETKVRMVQDSLVELT